MSARVIAVCSRPTHSIRKHPKTSICLVAGLGVEGDAHFGSTTQHLYLLKKDPTRANLTQVHLMHAELHDLLNDNGFEIFSGVLGENITTRELDLMALPCGSQLKVGPHAILQVTGYRQPCTKLDRVKPGLMKATSKRDHFNRIVPNAGVMAVVLHGGTVIAGDEIQVDLPDEPHLPLPPV